LIEITYDGSHVLIMCVIGVSVGRLLNPTGVCVIITQGHTRLFTEDGVATAWTLFYLTTAASHFPSAGLSYDTSTCDK